MTFSDHQELMMLRSTDEQVKFMDLDFWSKPRMRHALDLAFLAGSESVLEFQLQPKTKEEK